MAPYEFTTFVVTVDATDAVLGTSHVAEEIRQALEANGCRIVPCGWSPDEDTIADALVPRGELPEGYEWPTVEVIDLNPDRT